MIFIFPYIEGYIIALYLFTHVCVFVCVCLCLLIVE